VNRRHSCFVSVGEFSGDLIASDMIQHLKSTVPMVEFFGITGAALDKAGVIRIGSIDELSVMGIVEVLKKLPDLLELENRVLAEVDRRKPKLAILVDFPGFHFRLAEQLKLRGIKVVQFVAPKLWAWGAHRAKALRDDFDLVLGILPFETDYFVPRGINYKYIGSPQVDRVGRVVVKASDVGFSESDRIIACLPGSRMNEVSRMLPVIYSVATVLDKKVPGLTYVIPIASNLKLSEVIDCLRDKGIEHDLVACSETGNTIYKYGNLNFVTGMSLEVMAISEAAIVTSGTATLECGLLGTPMVVVYSMNETTYDLAKSRVTISDFSLVNIVAEKKIVTEYIQHFEVTDISREMEEILTHGDKYGEMKREFELVANKLSGHAGQNASVEIAKLLQKNKRTRILA